jgi:hypothetical protein
MKRIVESVFGPGLKGWGGLLTAALRGVPEEDYGHYKERLFDTLRDEVFNKKRPLFDVAEEFFRYSVEILGSVATIPATGPLVVVAPHPSNGPLDGFALAKALCVRRDDIKIFADSRHLKLKWPIGDVLLPVDRKDPRLSARSVRKAMNHLVDGHCVAMFPARVNDSMDTDGFSTPWSLVVPKLLIKTADAGLEPVIQPLHLALTGTWPTALPGLKLASLLMSDPEQRTSLWEMRRILRPRKFALDILPAYRLAKDQLVRLDTGASVLSLPREKSEKARVLLDFIRERTYQIPRYAF